jgi:ribosomal-protein-alanine N-acetyltransferase
MAIVPTLFTERLVLREWEPRDFDPYVEMCADPATMRYLGAGTPLTRDEVAARVDGYFTEEWSRWGHGHWTVALRATGEFVGYCGLLRWREGTPEQTGEIAYGFARPHWGVGFATEAARAAMQWGLVNFDWERIVGLTHPDNVASQRVLARLGMTSAGDWDGPHHRMKGFEVSREAFLAS